ILRIHGVHPRAMRDHFALYCTLMHRPSPLSRVQREAIAVLVSGINGCVY
ncbi:MAG: peroxidase, partial [Candidatus Eisenbacteria bacterium]|nr:peroxidase [Candidatus Latescibacterota bacterium]MBD3302660.1 peroxidase [Candidatus Eisenbacteria bacterium]